MQLVDDVRKVLGASSDVSAILGLTPFDDFSQMAGALFASITGSRPIGDVVARTYAADPALIDLTLHDITQTAQRNFEPGGVAAAFLFARGVHAVMAHRVAHHIWMHEDRNLSLAVKATCGRVLDTDMHPAARIGSGLWLDHGLGFVLGETSVIGTDVSIWHNVTLGSTLSDDGPFRHPHVGDGVVIGAGAILLGGITVGTRANIAAGAIVVTDVAAGTLMVGTKAQARGAAAISFIK